MESSGIRCVFALCGSFCTFSQVISVMEDLVSKGYHVLPLMSYSAYSTDTRYGKAAEHIERIEKITGHKIIHSIQEAEPIGPENLCDAFVIAPCTGNTLAKLANGITDTPVLMGAKSHLRNAQPLIIAISTNDALSANAKNLGILFNTKNCYFVPFCQDSPQKKKNSLVARFELIPQTIEAAMEGKQLQPVIFGT